MISAVAGSYADHSADLLICKQNGVIMRELASSLEFDRWLPVRWAPSLGGHKEKAALYSTSNANYKKVLAVSYNPKSNRPDAFSPNLFPHGCNILQVLLGCLYEVIDIDGVVKTVVLTPLSWRNPEMIDHVVASLFKEFEFLEEYCKASLLFVSPDPRPRIKQLYEQRFHICEQYFNALGQYWKERV